MPSPSLSSCVLVLNYNGREHLEDCLGSAVAAAAAVAGGRVVLVDNRSTDDSVAFTREQFPMVEVVIAPVNDFLFSLNEVVRARTEEIVVIVNNDMRFDRQFVAALLPHFKDPAVFGVGAAIRTWDGSANTVGPRCARLTFCWFYKWWELDRQEPAETLEASAGAAAYRREMFLQLGGFDPLYRPGYFEDMDLSYRAWMHDWTVRYEPDSKSFHKISVSMVRRLGEDGKLRLLYRNHILFTIKNVGGLAFLLGFLVLLPMRALRPLLRGDAVPLAGALRALPLMPRALRARFKGPRRVLDIERFSQVRPIASATDATTSRLSAGGRTR
ncbi:MAG TPA: glycosyltransferase family 2 protein [Vicinamibacterales bacterium]|jgi:GT2 family glycosyltransferase